MANKVYKHVPLGKDEYLGYVNQEGRVFKYRIGPDKNIGRVDIETGKIYLKRLGKDKYIGNVDLESGRVFFGKLGPDKYIGRVDSDGRLYLHQRVAKDTYIARVKEMTSLAHAGAAFLLLVEPALDEKAEKAPAAEQVDPEAGQAPSPA